jgi:hypothetical protein
MNQELSKNLVCLLTKTGVEIWMEEDRAANIKKVLREGAEWLDFDDKFISKTDISGFYPAYDMEGRTRRKNGEWKCRYNEWHDRFKKCGCEEIEKSDAAVKATDEMLKSRGQKVEPQS